MRPLDFAPGRDAALRPLAEALEERVLHSADLGGALLGAPATLHADADTPGNLSLSRSSVEIVFVDQGIDDADRLVADLQAQQAAGRPIEVVTIARGEDGLQAISQALAGREAVGAIHVLAHGSDGVLQLGATALDASTLFIRAAEVAGWATALSAQADLLLYGCDLAAGPAGQLLLSDLAALTGADVAASTDLTGAAAAGGDWELEFRTGQIEAASAPSASFQAGWQGVLATYRVTTAGEGLLAELLGLTLRSAISQANANPGPDVIVFDVDGTFNVASGSGDDSNGSGDFDITDDLTIIGRGTGLTLISGDGLDRVFDIQGASVQFSDLTVTDGRNSSGAGIRLDANSSATLTNVVVRENVGDGGSSGAGIYSEGNLVLRNVSIVNNGDTTSGNVKGGGIMVRAGSTLDARDVEVRGNRAAGNELGGGAYIESSATAVFQNVTFQGNVARSGGGLATEASSQTTLRNVTFSGNSAGQFGGGLFVQGGVSLEHVTVANNTAGQGGGLRLAADGDLRTGNSLFVGNTGGNASLAGASILSGGWNLSTDATLDLTGPGDRNSTAVTLGPLASNGGFTRTHELPAGSPAIDAADPSSTRTLDQRGVPVLGGRADIGAFESNPFGQAPTISAVADRNTAEDAAPIAVDVTVADAETAAGSLVVTATSSNASLVAAGGLVVSGTGSTRTVTVSPTANASGSAVITVRVSDGGNVSTTTFTLNVTPVNDAPTINLPSLGLSQEDQPVDFGPGQSIVIQDVDGGTVQVSLTATNGLLTLRGGAGDLAFVSGSPTAAAAMVFQGTLASVAAALNQLRFTPSPDHFGAVRINVGVNDLANGGGPARSSSAELAWMVAPVNDAPSLGLPGPQATPFGTPLDFSSANGNAITVSDVDSGLLTIGLDVVSVDGIAAGNLQITNPSEASRVVGSTASGLTLQGTTAQLNQALGFLRLNATVGGLLEISIVLVDDAATQSGGSLSTSGSVGVSIGSNLAPALTLSRTTLTTAENDPPAPLDPGLIVADDEGLLTGVTFRFDSGFAAAEDVLGFTPTSGTGDIRAVSSQGMLSLVSDGGATLAQWQAAARSVTYTNTSDAPSTTPRVISLVLSDGNSVSASRSLTVQVTGRNDAPDLVGPGPLAAVMEDSTSPSGTPVSTLIAGLETDRDGSDTPGIAVIGLDSTHGLWQYTLNGGATWLDFGAVSDSAARLLRADELTAVRFVPNANWNGAVPAGLSYRAWDGTSGTAGLLADASVNGGTTAFSATAVSAGTTVLPVNDAPVAGAALANVTATEDQPFSLTLPAGLFNDVDGDPLAWSVALASGAALPTWLQFDAPTRTLSGTPANGDVGSLVLRLTATDPDGAIATSDLNLRVLNVNDPPTATPIGAQTTIQGQVFEFALPPGSFVDGDQGDSLSLSASLGGGAALPGWLAFDPIGRVFRGTPLDADVGTLVLQVTATDESQVSVSTTFSLTVLNANDAPRALGPVPPQTAREDAPFSFTWPAGLFADDDEDEGDVLTLSAARGDGSALPGWLSFDPTTGRFSGTPTNADVGSLSLRVTSTDRDGESASIVFDLTVLNENDAPRPGVSIGMQTATQGTPFQFPVPREAFFDEDAGDSLALSASLEGGSALPAWLRFDPIAGRFTGTPGNDDVGSISVRLTAVDGAGASASTVFGITVANTNDAPVVAAPLPGGTAVQDQPFVYRVPPGTFEDVDGDALTLSASRASGEPLPAWLRFDPATGSFLGTPANADVGTVSLQVTATDASGARVSAVFAVTVANVNDGPVLTGTLDDQTANTNQPFVLNLPAGLFVDPDVGDALTLSAALIDGSDLPAWLRFDPARGRFEGLPGPDDAGSLRIQVTAQDPAGASVATTLVVDVRVVLGAPTPELPEAPRPPLDIPPMAEASAPPPAAAPSEPRPASPERATVSRNGAIDSQGDGVDSSAPESALAPAVQTQEGVGVASTAAPTAASLEIRRPTSRSDAVLAEVLLTPVSAFAAPATMPLLRLEEMQRSWQAFEESVQQRGAEQREVVTSGLLLSGGLSVGYVVWIIRGGVLASSMLSALPAWQMIDPMPVLAAARRERPEAFPPEDEDQGVERLFDARRSAQVPSAPGDADRSPHARPDLPPEAPSDARSEGRRAGTNANPHEVSA